MASSHIQVVNPVENTKTYCGICNQHLLESLPWVTFNECVDQHIFHKSCLDSHIQIKRQEISNGVIIGCPTSNCGQGNILQHSLITPQGTYISNESRAKTCDICGRTFNFTSQKCEHRKSHFQAYLICDQCGNQYKLPISLKKHQPKCRLIP